MAEYRVKVRTRDGGVVVVARTDSLKEAFQIFQSKPGPAVVMSHPNRTVFFAKES